VCDAQTVATLEHATVERLLARDDAQQARLAGAIAADETDALPDATTRLAPSSSGAMP
jgi:hypothetical protein